MTVMRLVRSAASALRRDTRGATMIEFAFLAPFVGVMVVGIADLGRGFSERYSLESAAHRTLERAGVGSTEPDYSFLRQEAATAANVPIEQVTFDNWVECDGTRLPTYESACTSEQQIARYIQVKIEKVFQPSFNWTGGPMPISGDAAVRIQ